MIRFSCCIVFSLNLNSGCPYSDHYFDSRSFNSRSVSLKISFVGPNLKVNHNFIGASSQFTFIAITSIETAVYQYLRASTPSTVIFINSTKSTTIEEAVAKDKPTAAPRLRAHCDSDSNFMVNTINFRSCYIEY